MKEYTVKNTQLLEKKLDKYLGYLTNRKKSPQYLDFKVLADILKDTETELFQ